MFFNANLKEVAVICQREYVLNHIYVIQLFPHSRITNSNLFTHLSHFECVWNKNHKFQQE
jgi:hypothetical protein